MLLAAVSEALVATDGAITLAAQEICRLVAEAFGDPAVLRLGGSEDELEVVGVGAPAVGLSEDVVRTFDTGRPPGMVRRAFRTGRAVYVSVDENHVEERPMLRAFQQRVGFRGSLIAPLRVRGVVIGTLSAICTCEHHDHGEADLRVIEAVADHIAAEIDESRLPELLAREVRPRSLAERRHAALLSYASDVIVVVSATGKVLDVSPAVRAVLGWEQGDLLRGSLFDLVDVLDRARAADDFAEVIGTPGPNPTTEYRIGHANGTDRWMEITANNLLDDPAVAAIVITARDVTERHLAGELLAVENKILQQIAAVAPLQGILDTLCLLVESRIRGSIASVWVLEGPDRLVKRASPSIDVGSMTGGEDLVLDPGHIGLLGAEHPPVLVTDVETSPEWAGFQDLAHTFGITGSWSRAICEPTGPALGSIVAFFAEMSEPTAEQVQVLELATHLAGLALTRDRSSRELAHAATHDALTGLPNRARFLDQLGRVLARAGTDGEVAVLFVDLDDFKTVNDTSGHAVGDQLLRQAGARLAAVVRPLDLIARLGGDEFAVLCDGIGVVEAGAIARRVLEALDAPFQLDGRSFHVSASTGIAVGNATTTPDSVLRDADTAMYQAKRDGRNRYTVFTPAVREATVRRSALEQDLRRAIEACELTVDYQPVVSLETGALVGLEALARWTSPEHGVISPLEFIEVAERGGMIVALGASILRQAVGQAAVWRASGLIADDVTMAVNVAAQQLADPGFVSTVIDALAAVGLPCTALCLELTESAVMADVDGARATLGLLRSLGVTLAIDDFGTGHSSLARLRSLEASVLKLDRMFIVDLEHDASSVGMVESIVQLAHALGKRLVVEGIETPEQLRILRELGADAVQGFHLARPAPAAATEGLLRVTPSWLFR
ncbi:MAG: Diguanylate cyclase protein [Actinomycetia bacterium]|nr:Diguanylate cyclase protein [Actinomycetes bacterium]